jgi:hypothetical protein
MSELVIQRPYIFIILCSQSEISLVLLGNISGSKSQFLSLGTWISISQSELNIFFFEYQFL